MFVKTKIVLLISIIIFILVPVAWAAEIEISATVDRQTVALNQSFTYSLQISGEKANSIGDPKIPDLAEFANYLGSSGTSQNIQIINGKMSVSKSMSFSFMASKAGKYSIPPSEIHLNGKVFKSNVLTIEIVAKAPTSQQQKSRSSRSKHQVAPPDQTGEIEDNLFLRPFVNKRKVYVNEPLILRYKIYTAVTVTSYGISKQPNMSGFWAEEFDLGKQPKTSREMYKGREFIVAEIKKVALFPTDAGKKTISPMQIECDVRVQNRRRSIFDSFFDDPFFGRTVRQVVTSAPVSIEVLPLPQEGKPADFSGAVGNFSLTATVDKNKVKTNEAIALKVRISGTGNIKVLPKPDIYIPPDFEQYEPKVTQNINRSGTSVSGSKTYEYVLIPRFPGIQKIKPVTFTFFDTNSQKYKRVTTPEITIDVEKGSEEFIVTGSGLSKEEVKLLGKDIRFIQQRTPQFRKIGYYLYQSPLFLLFVICPLFAIIAALFYKLHLDKLNENVAYARSRKANQLAMNRLRKARRKMTEDTEKEFYAEIAKALLGFLGDKLNISAVSIITDQVEQMMKERQIKSEVINQYLQCLQVCDYQRFAPASSNLIDMKKFYDQARKAIVSLEKVI